MQHLTSSSGCVVLGISPGAKPKELLRLMSPGYQGKDGKYYTLNDIADLVEAGIAASLMQRQVWQRLSFPIKLGNLFVWQAMPQGGLFWGQINDLLHLEAYNESVNLTDS